MPKDRYNPYRPLRLWSALAYGLIADLFILQVMGVRPQTLYLMPIAPVLILLLIRIVNAALKRQQAMEQAAETAENTR